MDRRGEGRGEINLDDKGAANVLRAAHETPLQSHRDPHCELIRRFLELAILALKQLFNHHHASVTMLIEGGKTYTWDNMASRHTANQAGKVVLKFVQNQSCFSG